MVTQHSTIIDNAKPTCLDEQWHLQLHFVIVEVTQNILFYELDVLYIFGIKVY